jgi:GMP synthase (glutamine-hydrolysing)
VSDQLRFLLLQARNPDDPVRNEEQQAFAKRLDVAEDQIIQADIFRDELSPQRLQDVDALLVGGAGEYSVLDDDDGVRACISLLTHAAEHGFPTFGSCFGFQALVVGLGGEVVQDEGSAEVGTYALERTAAAAEDPLFCSLPPQFLAQLGHKDMASRMPDGVVNLARSERAPHQALVIPGSPVYATQFHPELTWLDNRQRFKRYMEHYGKLFGQAEAQRRLDAHLPSPEANTLLRRFRETFLDGGTP